MEGMKFEEVVKGDRQLSIIFKLHLHFDIELTPSLLAYLERKMVNHYQLDEGKMKYLVDVVESYYEEWM